MLVTRSRGHRIGKKYITTLLQQEKEFSFMRDLWSPDPASPRFNVFRTTFRNTNLRAASSNSILTATDLITGKAKMVLQDCEDDKRRADFPGQEKRSPTLPSTARPLAKNCSGINSARSHIATSLIAVLYHSRH
jgi:hypothetical protein